MDTTAPSTSRSHQDDAVAFERRIVSQASAPTAARQKGGRYAGSRFAARFKLRGLNVGSLYQKRTRESEENQCFE